MVTKVARKEVRPEQKAETTDTVLVTAAASSSDTMCGCSHLPSAPHQVEEDVSRCLAADPNIHISSLVVRRIPNGVCIEGVLETDDGPPDVSSMVRCIPGITEVVNHLVVRRPPPKG